jgi:putative ABC transport system substrate-binding protein
MKRREFIALAGGAAAASTLSWPLAAREQPTGKVARIGFLRVGPPPPSFIEPLRQGLKGLGYLEDKNFVFDYGLAQRVDQLPGLAAELVRRKVDVLVASGTPAVIPARNATSAIPVVFIAALDPVATGVVTSLARPGGNVTGFMNFEYSISGKWLELLKQIAPGVTRVAVLRDATQGSGTSQFAVIQAAAPSLRVEVNPVNMRDAGEIERAVAAFARAPDGGMIVSAGAAAQRYRDLIVTLAAQHKLPAVYPNRIFVADGGLMSYGPNTVEQFRQAAGYVDRILKGEKPADLPVQAPTKYELVINLKAAKALGLTVPPTVLARADEVIE